METKKNFKGLFLIIFLFLGMHGFGSKNDHPLLKDTREIILSEIQEIQSTANENDKNLIFNLIKSSKKVSRTMDLKIDYPFNKSIFPQEFIAPGFLWHDSNENVDTWLIDISFKNNTNHIYFLVPGIPQPLGEKDPACEVEHIKYIPPDYQLSAHWWKPGKNIWTLIKKESLAGEAHIKISGFNSSKPSKFLSSNVIKISISTDPVDGRIFYRDVPLVPGVTKHGVIKPLAEGALPLITWRLRDISQPESRVLLKKMPTCANCHSFSTDGKYLAMDLDGPSGDKGTYLISEIKPKMEIKKTDIITWNSLKERPKDHNTLGFMAQLSPDGQFAVATVNEAVYVNNFTDYQFLQVFFPTRGLLGYYSKKSGEIKLLPGGDNTEYVHCDPAWSPDGKYIVFARGKSRPPYEKDQKMAAYANDPIETKMRYDLYRIDFNNGKGGVPVPIKGASNNGMSNSFPKVSPDGKWVVFVKCRNGQLMRPDSELWIVPTDGGVARKMKCNTSRMNSWHSFSPNGRWMVFSSKANTPYTQMFITHIDENGNDSPPILIPNSTAANRAVNIPEFVNIEYNDLLEIEVPVVRYHLLRKRADTLFQKGELEESIQIYLESIQLNPEFDEAYYSIGAAYYNLKKFKQAKDYFEKSIQIDPEKSEGYHLLGKTLSRLGEYDKSVYNFLKALELDLENAEIYFDLGNTLVLKKELEKAIRAYENAVLYAPKKPKYLFALGRIHFGLQDHDKSLEYFQKGIQISPKDKDALWKIGDIYFLKKEYEKAKGYYMRYLELDESNMGIYLNIGNILKKAGELNEAIQFFEKARMIDPKNAHPYFHLGGVYLQLMKFKESIDFFKKGFEFSPNDPIAHVYCGNANFSLQEYETALSHYKKALELDPQLVMVHFDWGNVLFKLKRYEEAIQHYQKILEVYPNDKDVINNLEFAKEALEKQKNHQR